MTEGQPASRHGSVAGVSDSRVLGEPVAYLLHLGMGNEQVVEARGFDVEANRRLDPLPLFRCPTWPHEKGMVYDSTTDEAVCRLCGYRTSNEMGSL